MPFELGTYSRAHRIEFDPTNSVRAQVIVEPR
jgi:hypothetical protein